MKHILLLASLILLTNSVFTQEILSIETEPIKQTFAVDLSNIVLDLQMHATITNNSSDALELRWVREITKKPNAWQTQVSDNNLCYNPIVGTNYDPDIGLNMPVFLDPGASFDLTFHVFPKGSSGYGEFEVPFYLLSEENTTFLSKAIFKVRVESLTEIDNGAKEKLKIFPNPATDYIELIDNYIVDKMVVYNLLGREVRNFEVLNGKHYQIGDLPNGMYLVSLINEKEGILKTFRISKRSIRP